MVSLERVPHLLAFRSWRPAATLGLALALVVTFPREGVTQDSPSSSEIGAALDSVYRRALRDWNVPGFAVAVVRGDSVLLVRGYGVRTLGASVPVDADTRFYTASVTKGFTAAAVGLLADQGRLRPNDPLTRYLPSFALADTVVSTRLTIADLLTQRTGVPRADLLLFSGMRDEELLSRMHALAPEPALRTRLAYSNQMYQLLGAVVAGRSGESFTSFVESKLLAPLGMTRSDARGAGATAVANAATPHGEIDGVIRALPPIARAGTGAGAVNASARDLAQWARFLLGGGSIAGTRVASEGVVRALMTPQTIASPITLLPGSTVATYGMGGFVHDYRGYLAYTNAGQGEGWAASIVTLPAARVGVVVLANLHGTLLPQALVATTLDRLLALPSRDWLSAYRQLDATPRAPQRANGTEPRVGTALRGMIVGRFSHPLYGDLVVEQNGPTARLRYGTLLDGTLVATTDSTARVAWQNAAVTAVLPDARVQLRLRGDSAQSILLEFGTDRIEFTRRP